MGLPSTAGRVYQYIKDYDKLEKQSLQRICLEHGQVLWFTIENTTLNSLYYRYGDKVIYDPRKYIGPQGRCTFSVGVKSDTDRLKGSLVFLLEDPQKSFQHEIKINFDLDSDDALLNIYGDLPKGDGFRKRAEYEDDRIRVYAGGISIATGVFSSDDGLAIGIEDRESRLPKKYRETYAQTLTEYETRCETFKNAEWDAVFAARGPDPNDGRKIPQTPWYTSIEEERTGRYYYEPGTWNEDTSEGIKEDWRRKQKTFNEKYEAYWDLLGSYDRGQVSASDLEDWQRKYEEENEGEWRKERRLKTAFAPVFTSTSGIGGYDLKSGSDRAFAYDCDSTGKLDHIVLLRPGGGACYVVEHREDSWHAKYAFHNGIGGYDLSNAADRGIAFDWNSTGNLDHLVFYRPGHGTLFVIGRSGNGFAPVFQTSGSGTGGYDLSSPDDKIIAFDYNHTGKQDHLLAYRPGTGICWILRRDQNQFHPVYQTGASSGGVGGFVSLDNPTDRIIALDHHGNGQPDCLAIYRPGGLDFWILRNEEGTFQLEERTHDYSGYLQTPGGAVFAFDWDGTGKQNQLAFHDSGTGTMTIAKRFWNAGGYWKQWQQIDGGLNRGIGGYDLMSPEDKLVAFDHDHSSKCDHIVCYRADGGGTIWIMKHAYRE